MFLCSESHVGTCTKRLGIETESNQAALEGAEIGRRKRREMTFDPALISLSFLAKLFGNDCPRGPCFLTITITTSARACLVYTENNRDVVTVFDYGWCLVLSLTKGGLSTGHLLVSILPSLESPSFESGPRACSPSGSVLCHLKRSTASWVREGSGNACLP